MFGTFRYVLAGVVLLNHFSTVPLVGKYAVYVFFMLSGYLMTHILNKVYKDNVKGYLLNRVLRIYPTYLAVLLLTVLAGMAGFHLYKTPNTVLVPESLYAWAKYLLILDVDLVAPAWTLKIELVYYVLMIYLATSLSRVKVWFGVSLGIAGLIAVGTMTGILVKPTFGNVIAASVPFSFGAWMWYQREERLVNFGRIATYSGLLVGSMLLPVIFDVRYTVFEWMGLLLTTGIGGLLVLELSNLKGTFKKVDDFLGDLSYPIYLSHILAGSLVVVLFGLEKLSIEMALMGFVLTHFLSIGIRIYVERPIEALRKRIRSASYNYSPSQVSAKAQGAFRNSQSPFNSRIAICRMKKHQSKNEPYNAHSTALGVRPRSLLFVHHSSKHVWAEVKTDNSKNDPSELAVRDFH